MKKILNEPENFVKETVEGIVAAYGDRVKLLNGDFRVLLNAHETREGKVGIVTGGGSGHLPLFLGYVGDGMLDGCAIGNVFASPAYTKMADMIRACDKGAGVLCLYGNYGGDKLNFNQAIDDVKFDDIRCTTVLGADDVVSAPEEEKEKRRGVAGIVYAFKCAGAAAARGMDLDEVTAVAQKVCDNVRTMGFALTPCIVPEVGKSTFSVAEDEIEIGMGIHGEKGIEVRKMITADEIAQIAMEKILADMPLDIGDEVSVMINGLGGTPMEEQLITFRSVHRILRERGVFVFMPHIGEYATSMEMAGLSVSVFKLDAQLRELLLDPADTPFYTNHNK